jgi:RNA polymerase sigma-70 factor (ECF subfamily)
MVTTGRTAAAARSDAGLVEAARGGDHAAFAELHARYWRVVRAVLLGTLAAPDADDALQDVFVTALTRLSSLRDPGAFGGWLLRIARNRAADLKRRTPPQKMRELDESYGTAETSTDAAEAARALEAIRTLPEAYRETLVMRLVEGLTGPEIAERTGMTPGSVRVNLHRGLHLLREKLRVSS